MKLHELIVKVAETGLHSQKSDGSMVPGQNGPYNDIETPVRNTSHWAITFVKAFQLTSKEKFKKAALACTEYLSGQQARPYGKTFWHRESDSKDKCNGLIGQAWSIESICVVSNAFNIPELADLATEIFHLHPFNSKKKLWNRVEIDGVILSIDETFNHQLWFAAAASMINSNDTDTIHKQIKLFLQGIQQNIAQYRNGLIGQSIKTKKRIIYNKNLLLSFKIFIAQLIQSKQKRNWSLYKSIGYHTFNLYAFALLAKKFGCDSIWPETIINDALNYAKSHEFNNQIKGNQFGFAYNPPGFELPLALIEFEKDKTKVDHTYISKLISDQLTMNFNFETSIMDKNNHDPATHTARIYEATRLPDLNLFI